MSEKLTNCKYVKPKVWKGKLSQHFKFNRHIQHENSEVNNVSIVLHINGVLIPSLHFHKNWKSCRKPS